MGFYLLLVKLSMYVHTLNGELAKAMVTMGRQVLAIMPMRQPLHLDEENFFVDQRVLDAVLGIWLLGRAVLPFDPIIYVFVTKYKPSINVFNTDLERLHFIFQTG